MRYVPCARRSVTLLDSSHPDLPARLAAPGAVLVACLCAEWCGTCREYRDKLAALAARMPDHVFVWVDIEEDHELAGDEDIEDFPTLLVQDADGALFYGTMLPHIGHLEKLLASLQTSRPAPPAAAPDVLGLLRARA